MANTNQYLTGEFKLPDGREVFGSLRLCGESTKAEFFDDAPFPALENTGYITGELHDGRLASLLRCTFMGTGWRMGTSNTRKHAATVFPHFIALGPAYVSKSSPCVASLSFVMKDAPAIFFDAGAFSTVVDTEAFASFLRDDKNKHRDVELGERPIIAYFTGKYDIAVVDTVLGELRAHHRPTHDLGGPSGVRIDNEVTVSLTPAEPIVFHEAARRLWTLLRFFGLIAGREQPLYALTVTLENQPERSLPIDIHRSFAPTSRDEVDSDEIRSCHPSDVLINTLHDTKQYATVLKRYLASDSERRDSRDRLRNSLGSTNSYSVDRIVAAANVFDIFPDSAYPEQTTLAPELAQAKAEARSLFRALTRSIERDAMLSAIGRIGKLSLKHKMRHRITSTGLDKHFPRLVEVLDEAVKCRNHYVHGSPGSVDYSANFDIVIFFTDALEFAFAASDLIDVGWDFSTWKNGLPASHPFAAFTMNYLDQLKYFEELTNLAGGD